MLKKALQFKIFLGAFVIVILAVSIFFRSALTTDLKINEISFTNNDGSDWIEIYNPSLNTKSLRGLYLTDDNANLLKFKIKRDIFIPPKGYAVIYGKDFDLKGSDFEKMSFSIKNGETVYLVDRDKSTLIDSMTALISEDESTTATSVGRMPDGADTVFVLGSETLGSSNKPN